METQSLGRSPFGMLLVGHRPPPHSAHVGRSRPNDHDVERLANSPTDANVCDVARDSLGLEIRERQTLLSPFTPTPLAHTKTVEKTVAGRGRVKEGRRERRLYFPMFSAELPSPLF